MVLLLQKNVLFRLNFGKGTKKIRVQIRTMKAEKEEL